MPDTPETPTPGEATPEHASHDLGFDLPPGLAEPTETTSLAMSFLEMTRASRSRWRTCGKSKSMA